MNRSVLFALVAIALITAFAGCSKNPAEPSATNAAGLNLNTPTGGYTSSNEAPGFGDPILDPALSGEKPYADPMYDSTVDSMRSNLAVDWYHFRAQWGHLVPDTAESTWTDWSGSLTINRGALVLRRTIKFEDNDSILPRTDRRKIEWVSRTRPASDGIAVDIFLPRPQPVIDTVTDSALTVDTTLIIDSLPVIDTIWVVDTLTNDSTFTLGFHFEYDTTAMYDTTFTPVTVVDTVYPSNDASLVFSTLNYSRTFSLADLMKLDTIITLADSNEVAFQAMRIYRNVCPRGFLAGHWSAIDSTGFGYLNGRWIGKWGIADGYFEGHYGYNDDSVKVFFGKWIDSVGEFEGFLQGRWGILPNKHGQDEAGNGTETLVRGWFAGQILDANMTRIGVVRGGFGQCDSLASGFLAGRWKLICNDEEGDNPGGHNGQPRGGDGEHHDDDGMDD
jgi:hypothetical protein